jgi:predicted nucleic acid-binding protein
MDKVYHISLAHGDSLTTEHVILGDRTHRHWPGFDPGAGVVDVVGGLHAEVVALVSLAHKRRLGLGGVAQPGGPGAVLHVVVAQAGLPVLPQPGDAEVERDHGRHGDGHRGRDGILEEGEGLRGLVAGAVGGGDGYVRLVLLEVADALSAPRFRAQVVAFIDGLRQSGVTQIIPGGQDLLDAGWELYRRRPDKEWGLTDCTSFVVMEQQQITQAVTSDQHFEQAGFVKLL